MQAFRAQSECDVQTVPLLRATGCRHDRYLLLTRTLLGFTGRFLENKQQLFTNPLNSAPRSGLVPAVGRTLSSVLCVVLLCQTRNRNINFKDETNEQILEATEQAWGLGGAAQALGAPQGPHCGPPWASTPTPAEDSQ